MSPRPAARRVSRRTTVVRFRRVRAVLAGALVLGVGATFTLAAWTDQEHATAAITAGTFQLVSRTDINNAFQDHGENAAVLHLEALTLYPGESRAAYIQIQNTGSVPGTVALSSVSVQLPDGDPQHALLRDNLSVRVVQTSSATTGAPNCTPSTPGETSALSLTSVPENSPVPVNADAANTVNYCFILTLSPDAPNGAQGGAVTPTWVFTGSTPTS